MEYAPTEGIQSAVRNLASGFLSASLLEGSGRGRVNGHGSGRGSDPMPGNVYQGGLPPMLWIQREQQRTPLELTNTDGSTASSFESARLREEGNLAFKAERYTEAIDLYTRAIAADPSVALCYTNRSLAYFRLGDFVKSEADARAALVLNPFFYKAHFRLGLAQLSLGAYTLALVSLRRANELCPKGSESAIAVAIAKCESKMVRAPSTPLIAGSPVGQEGLLSPLIATPSGSSGYPLPEFEKLCSKVNHAASMRCRVESFNLQYDDERDIVACRERSQRVRQLLAVATSTSVADLSKEAQERQADLRSFLKSGIRADYHQAKRRRDEAYEKVWETAAVVEDAVIKLHSIASEEQTFFKRFRTTSLGHPEGSSHPEVDEPTSDECVAESSQVKPLSEDDGERFAELLRRRLIIHESIQAVGKCYPKTNAAAAALMNALQLEEEASEKLPALLEETAAIHKEIEAYARRVAETTTKELSDTRLDALEQVRSYIDRVKADEDAFKVTQAEGDQLLNEEAALERVRLQLERQRIQLQAEVEWFKVRDEPTSKIAVLQNYIKDIQDQVAETDTTQKGVQKRILELVEGHHPELAWKSMASGSRILRLVKGSGLWLNLSFSDFQIVSTLSSTVNSKVYHAMRRGEHVALKEVAIDNDAARRRFQREINIVAACSHPNIIRIKGVFFDGNFAYILLPYYHRGSMKTLLSKKEPLSWVMVQDLFRQLASGVAYLHERGVIHGDLKPSNILLADDGRPIVSDFGIAKDHGRFGEPAEDVTVTLTTTGGVTSGTMTYMAPEQRLGESRAATGKSDVWALGISFYEVATANACFNDPRLTGSMPSVSDISALAGSGNMQNVNISAKYFGGDERLADMIMSALRVDVTIRATAYELLGHPYFGSTLNPMYSTQTSLLAKSDERIEAVRSYIHALRAGEQKLLVSVSRNQMLASLASIFDRISPEDILSPMVVVFQGEAGIDEGALTTEMLSLYYEQLVTEKKALVCTATSESSAALEGIVLGSSYLPAEDDGNTPIPPSVFRLLGKVLLKSVIENRPIPLKLSLAVLKYFCNVPVSTVDLEEFDGEMAEGLKRLRLLTSEGLTAAELNFSHFTSTFLAQQMDGRYMRETAVTTDNVQDYVTLRVQFDLIDKRKRALEAMKTGFYSCTKLEPHLRLLSPSDLLLLLCGVQHVPAQAIIHALDFQNFDSASNTPAHLRDILSGMSQNNLRRFLQFCTSSAAIPANNSMKRIKVLRTSDTSRLPVGHGCVNQLDLPDYNDRQVLQEKLEVALTHLSDGFHIL